MREWKPTRCAAPAGRPGPPEAFDPRPSRHDHSFGMTRIFTPGEANAALVELRPLVEQLVQHRRNLAAAQSQQTDLITRIAGNGGDMQPSDLRKAAETIEREAVAIAECAERINAAGAQIKSLEEGLLDFPARR